MDQLKAMTVFRAVALEGGFAAAARRLGLSPPVVTRAVADLEAHLGLTLFHRSTRRVELTEGGARYLEDVARILDQIDTAERRVAGNKGVIRGELRITAPVMYGQLHIMPVGASLLRAHPDLDIQLLLLDRNVRMEEEGIDVAVRVGAQPDSAYRSVRIDAVQQVVVASPGYLERRGVPLTPDDIAGHATILSTTVERRTYWRFGERGRVRVPIAPRLSVNSVAACLAAAEEGLGLACLFDYQAAAALERGVLVTVLDRCRLAPVPVQLLFAADRARLPAVRAFIDAARSARTPG
ncbi:MAG: LysR family transcriptional regulator [Parasphingopyxis sp.]